MKAASNIFGKRKHFSRNLFQKTHCVQGASTELFLLTKKDHWCPWHYFFFLLGINLSKLKAQVLVQCNVMKTFKSTCFQNKHNSGLCFRALKVVVKPICSTTEIFSKILSKSIFIYIHNCKGDGGWKHTTIPQHSPTQN